MIEAMKRARELAKAAYFINEGYNQKAIDDLYEEIVDDPALLEVVLKMGCASLIRHNQSEERRDIEQETKRPYKIKTFTEEQQKYVQIMGERFATLGKWATYPLMRKGSKLATATKVEIMECVVSYQKDAYAMYKRGVFLEKIADGLQDNQSVHEVYTEADLDTLASLAEKEALKRFRMSVQNNKP
jgi:hypothetical protein